MGIKLIKLSLLLFYLTLAVNTAFGLIVFTLVGVGTSYSIPSVINVIFSCQPVSKCWKPSIQVGDCVDLPVFYIANLNLNSATNIAVVLLPAPLLWGLRMLLRHKVAVYGVFMTGIM